MAKAYPIGEFIKRLVSFQPKSELQRNEGIEQENANSAGSALKVPSAIDKLHATRIRHLQSQMPTFDIQRSGGKKTEKY